MIPASHPADEARRLAALERYAILDTAPEPEFDRVTRLAQRLFDVPIVLVSLIDVDRQWFKSCIGLEVSQTGRDESFCAHAIHHDTVLVVPDALEDERFVDNPLVTGDPRIRFYAGAPLRTRDGVNLGTLCVIDREPRPSLTDTEQATLTELAAIVVDELELRHALSRAVEAEATATAAIDERDRMLSRISHELRTPLNAVLGFAELLTLDDLDDGVRESVDHIRAAGRHLLALVDEVLDLTRVDAGDVALDLVPVAVSDLATAVRDVLAPTAAERDVNLAVEGPRDARVVADPERLRQILLSLINRAVERSEASATVTIGCSSQDGTVRVEVRDHGPDLAPADRDRVFLAFERLEDGTKTGLGLMLSRRLVEAMGGRIGAETPRHGGSTIWFELASANDHPR